METEEKTSEEMKNENGKNAMEPEEETNSGNSKKENEKNSTQREKISNNRYKIPPKNYKTFTGSRKLAPLNQSNDFSKGTFNLYYSQTMSNRKKENQTPKSELQTNEGLKEELRLMRLDLNKKTQELYELKIQFGKQLEENKKNDSFIKFFEEYYGYFKQFITKEDLYKIGKINKKTMSLILIYKGNYLHRLKESKKKKIKLIISFNPNKSTSF